jgi:hypothetical protein
MHATNTTRRGEVRDAREPPHASRRDRGPGHSDFAWKFVGWRCSGIADAPVSHVGCDNVKQEFCVPHLDTVEIVVFDAHIRSNCSKMLHGEMNF